nr:hypothetical protein [Desulfosarcina widdelii]
MKKSVGKATRPIERMFSQASKHAYSKQKARPATVIVSRQISLIWNQKILLGKSSEAIPRALAINLITMTTMIKIKPFAPGTCLWRQLWIPIATASKAAGSIGHMYGAVWYKPVMPYRKYKISYFSPVMPLNCRVGMQRQSNTIVFMNRDNYL